MKPLMILLVPLGWLAYLAGWISRFFLPTIFEISDGVWGDPAEPCYQVETNLEPYGDDEFRLIKKRKDDWWLVNKFSKKEDAFAFCYNIMQRADIHGKIKDTTRERR